MAFETLRNTVSYLREDLQKRKANRKPGQRNYMKEKKTDISSDPAYRALIENAADKKAPFAEKTKGYYRFSSDFPDRVDAEGYRINEPDKAKPLSRKGILLMTVALLVLFAAGFVLTDTALEISDAIPPNEVQTSENATTDGNFGESETLPQDTFGSSETVTEEPLADATVTEPTDEAVTSIPEETASISLPTVPESTIRFSDAPVENGQFTTQADGWN